MTRTLSQSIDAALDAYDCLSDGEDAREAGRTAWMKKSRGKQNPHNVGSFQDYCWEAGYDQDVRSIDELKRDWRKTPGVRKANG